MVGHQGLNGNLHVMQVEYCEQLVGSTRRAPVSHLGNQRSIPPEGTI